MKNATVKMKGIEKIYEVTKINAHFKIMLPPGKYSLEVNCHEYEPQILNVEVVKDEILSLQIKLEKLNSAAALPIKDDGRNSELDEGTLSLIKGKFYSSKNNCQLH